MLPDPKIAQEIESLKRQLKINMWMIPLTFILWMFSYYCLQLPFWTWAAGILFFYNLIWCIMTSIILKIGTFKQ